MPLSVGDRLGPYEILAPIGAGGMGEVWKARDTRLDRIVAIKVSKQQFPERFEQEARAVAALNHPHICQLYDVGPNYLLMEFVEGTTLKGPLPLEKAVEYATQILDALDAAHQKGIIHRDLKPANILVTKQGIKLLDFGLAKLTVRASEFDTTKALTDQGQIVGTLQYMSPEQLHGKEADARSDLFSFGCVLYELLAGKRAFDGTNKASVIVAILEREPMPLEVARPLDRIIRRSLAKDPDQRFQTARDLKAALSWALEQPAAVAIQPGRKMSWVVVPALAVALGVALWGPWRPAPLSDHSLKRLSVDLGSDAIDVQASNTAISPDGTRLVFPIKNSDGKQLLATRFLAETKSAPLSGTENGRDPFFSPDSQWIGFFADGKMKKISLQGGASVLLCDAPSPRGASWGDDDKIVAALTSAGGLSRIPAEGGAPQSVTKPQPGIATHRWPQILPGDESVLFTISSATTTVFADARIAAVSLKTGDVKILVRGGYFGRYVPSGGATGHLVYVRDGVLLAVPFDPKRLELRGAAVAMLDDLAADPSSGAGQFSFSQYGNILYRTGRMSAESWPIWWLDDSGKTRTLLAAPGYYIAPRFSPDGQRLALRKVASVDGGIYVYDWQRDTMSRLARNTQQATYPLWSPDGKHIVFRFFSDTGYTLGWIRADGAGEIQQLLDIKNMVIPYSFFPDGRRLAYHLIDPGRGSELWTLPLDLSDPDHPKPGKPELFLRGPGATSYPAASPDGRLMAYQSDESGRTEVYVRPFPGPGGKWQISNAGGSRPIWSRNGRELFFETLDDRIMVSNYEGKDESFIPGKPHLWSEQHLHEASNLNYDLAPDGKRFAIAPELKATSDEKGAIHMNFVENFFDELRRRAPARK